MPSVNETSAKSSAVGLSNRASWDLDLLRGVAAVMVVIGHWRTFFFQDYGQVAHPSRLVGLFYFLTLFGHQAVVVFFVLSGYLVGGSVIRSVANSRWSWRRYIVDRGSRLYVVLVPALLLGLAFDCSRVALFGSQGVYRHMTPTAAEFFGNLAFLQTIRTDVLGSNAPLWSLAYEFWYYVAFACLWTALFAKKSTTYRVLGLIVGAASLALVGWYATILFVVWLMGAALGNRRLPQVFSGVAARWLTFGLWLVTMALHRLDVFNRLFTWLPSSMRALGQPAGADLFLGLATAIWIAALISQPSGSEVRWRSGLSRGLSHVSYTGYLVHFPFLVWIKAYWLGNGAGFPVSFVSIAKVGTVLVPVALYIFIVWWLFERNTTVVRDRLRSVLIPSSVKG